MNIENESKDIHSATNDNNSSPDEQLEHPEDNRAKGSEGETDNAETIRKQPPSAVKAALFASAIAVVLGAGTYWYTTIQIPINEATDEFNQAAKSLESRNAELDKAILDLQEVLKSGEAPLDPSLTDAASAEIGLAQGERQEAPERPQSVEDIKSATKKLKRMGQYSDEIAGLQTAQFELEQSIKQLKQVTAPEESFVINRIQGVETISGVEAVTEDNDPNGNLGKAGGYTAAIYFSSNQVSPANLYLTGEYTPVVDAGCDGGGVIEVYATVEDAEKRNDYLSNFDGGILSSGSHSVLGTCVLRTSTHLKASQQKSLEEALTDALIRLD